MWVYLPGVIEVGFCGSLDTCDNPVENGRLLAGANGAGWGQTDFYLESQLRLFNDNVMSNIVLAQLPSDRALAKTRRNLEGQGL